MRRLNRFAVLACCVASVVMFVTADLIARPGRAAAQLGDGEFALYQPGSASPVGWVRVAGDHCVEWWAFVEGACSWADCSHSPTARWRLDAEYIGSGSWATYAIWKADVLQRVAVQGRTITFQDHSVVEESVEN